MALTTKQAAFVAAYLHYPNASKAALKAGYSKVTAPQAGYRLLKHPEIAAIIANPVSGATPEVVVNQAVDRWRVETERMAYDAMPVDEFRYDHKLRALESIAKAEGRYANESATSSAFAIQINLRSDINDDD